jgi:hypothetical protein
MQADTGTTRLLKKAEAYFCVLPPELPEFDHFTPADWLFRNAGILDGNDADAAQVLERAALVASAVNDILK